jgi:hypothetical protein
MKPFRPRVIHTETLSPTAYLAQRDTTRQTHPVAQIIPPRLGQPGFGGLRVTLKSPRYQAR